MRRAAGKRESAPAVRWRGFVYAAGLGVCVSVGVLCLCAWLIGAAVLPEQVAGLCAIFAAGAGVMAGVWLLGRWGSRGVLIGLGVGVLLAGVYAVTGVLLYSKIVPECCLLIGGVCAFSGAVAGMMWGRRRRKRRP